MSKIFSKEISVENGRIIVAMYESWWMRELSYLFMDRLFNSWFLCRICPNTSNSQFWWEQEGSKSLQHRLSVDRQWNSINSKVIFELTEMVFELFCFSVWPGMLSICWPWHCNMSLSVRSLHNVSGSDFVLGLLAITVEDRNSPCQLQTKLGWWVYPICQHFTRGTIINN